MCWAYKEKGSRAMSCCMLLYIAEGKHASHLEVYE